MFWFANSSWHNAGSAHRQQGQERIRADKQLKAEARRQGIAPARPRVSVQPPFCKTNLAAGLINKKLSAACGR